MQRVLIGVFAAVVLAGAVFAIVHFSSRQTPAFGPQNGWVPVVMTPVDRAVHVVGTFGSWRLVCRVVGPRRGSGAHAPALNNSPAASQFPKTRNICAVVLLVLKEPNGAVSREGRRFAPKEWLNLRFQRPPAGSGAIVLLAFAQAGIGKQSTAPSASQPEQVDLRVDKTTVGLIVRNCVRGTCLAGSELGPSDLEPILSAHTLAILLPRPAPAKVEDVHLPTDGLKAAFAAMQRQPA